MSKLPHFVRQEDPKGCLVACLAMVTGFRYGYIRGWMLERGCRVDGDRGGLLDVDVMAFLGLHGFAYDRRFRWCGANYQRQDWLQLFAPVHICGVANGGGHGVVVVASGTVLDPAVDHAADVAAGRRRTLEDYQPEYLLGVWNVRVAAAAEDAAQRLIEPIRARARELGYAIGLHGSLRRDIDLIAAPWRLEVASADDLVAAVVEVIKSLNGGYAFIRNDPDADPYDYTRRSPEPKPHGRLAWSIHLGNGPYVDLSVLPRKDS